MSIAAGASVLALPDRTPRIDASAFVADGARIVGGVTIEAGASVWYNAVLRADSAPIVVGAQSNVQDNVSVHGCTIGDGSLIGMGAVILSGAVIGEGCLIAGGAVVLGGSDIPSGSLVAGVPAKVRRPLTDEEREGLIANAEIYLRHQRTHAQATPV